MAIAPSTTSFASAAKAPAKVTAEEVIATWAAGLVPAQAPKLADKGHLAWVRETKVPELLEALKKAGVK